MFCQCSSKATFFTFLCTLRDSDNFLCLFLSHLFAVRLWVVTFLDNKQPKNGHFENRNTSEWNTPFINTNPNKIQSQSKTAFKLLFLRSYLFCLNGRKKEKEFRPLKVRRKLIALKKVERKLFKTHIVPCWPCKLNRFSYRRLYESNKHILNIWAFFCTHMETNF
jgi:hypothetical protein